MDGESGFGEFTHDTPTDVVADGVQIHGLAGWDRQFRPEPVSEIVPQSHVALAIYVATHEQ